MVLSPTSFTKQSILDEYYYTKLIESNIDTFFSKLPIYDELGIFPKRATLLYGPPGSGKSSVLAKICEKYSDTKDATVVVWPSDKFEARDVKDFLNSFDYNEHKVQKLILVIEDLGGAEQSSGIRYSEASLLALLDNVEATFKIPTVILATTNFPEMFLENLTNRPQRFDDVIEVKRPGKENRLKLLAFFKGSSLSLEEEALFSQSKFDIFSPAHLKEVIVRARLYDLSITESAELVFEQANRAIKQFTNKSRMGFD